MSTDNNGKQIESTTHEPTNAPAEKQGGDDFLKHVTIDGIRDQLVELSDENILKLKGLAVMHYDKPSLAYVNANVSKIIFAEVFDPLDDWAKDMEKNK